MAIENIGLYPITIDVYKKHKETTVYANDNDTNGRGLLITLVKDGVPFNSTGINLKIGFRNAVGEERLYDCDIVDVLTGKYKVFYPTEMLVGNGGRVVKLEIKAFEATGALLNYSPVFVYVNPAEISNGAIGGTNEASTLVNALSQVQNIDNRFDSVNAQLADIAVNVKSFGAIGDWDGTKGTDNLPYFIVALNALPYSGGEIIVPPGDYWLSDSFNIDKDNVAIKVMSGATIRTTTPTSGGHTIGFIGYLGAGTATTPQRKNAKIYGGGKVVNSSSGTNENAIACVRYSGFTCDGLVIPEANRKAVTCQYGVDNIIIRDIVGGIIGHSGISIETACKNVTIENINLEHCGDRAILITSQNALADMENLLIKNIRCKKSNNDGVYIDKFKKLSLSDVYIDEVIGRGFLVAGEDVELKNLNVYKSTREGYVISGRNVKLEIDGILTDQSSFGNSNTYDAILLQDIPAIPFNLKSSVVRGNEHRNAINMANSSGNTGRYQNNNIKTGVTSAYGGWKPKEIRDIVDGVLYEERNGTKVNQDIKGSGVLNGSTDVTITHNIGNVNYVVIVNAIGGTLVGKIVISKSNNAITVRSSDPSDRLAFDYVIKH